MAPTKKTHLTAVCFIAFFVLAKTFSKRITTENVVLNVTAVNERNQANYSVQMSLNVGLWDNETFINGAPLKASGVTRMPCPVLLMDVGELVFSELRLMLNHSYVESDAGDQVVLLVLSQEIIQLADQKVQQPDTCEVEILWNQTSAQVTHTKICSASRSKLTDIPREGDVQVTDAFLYNVGAQVFNTTSHYLQPHVETTEEEVAAPGKLPETPLRMDPDLLYQSREEERRSGSSQDESVFSYRVMCRWMEELRDKLRRFCSDSVPLFFLTMWVVVVGVAGSAIIIKFLDVLFPWREQRGFLHLNPETLMVDEEKQMLLDEAEKSFRIEK